MARRPNTRISNQADERHLFDLLNQAAAHLSEGQARKAVVLCDRVLKLSPGAPAALSLSGLALCMSGREKQGVARLEKAAKALPDDLGLALNLTNGLVQLNRLAEAETVARRTVAQAPGMAEAHNLLGIVLDHQRRQFDAAEAYRRAIALDGDNPDHYGNLMQLAASHGPMIAALTEAEDAHRKWPEDPELNRLFATLLRNSGQADRAIEICRETLAAHPGQTAVAMLLGELYADRGRRNDAREVFERLIAAGEETDEIYFSLTGVRDFAEGDPLLDLLAERARRNPAEPTPHFSLARAYDKAGAPDRAFAQYAEGNRRTLARFGPPNMTATEAHFETLKSVFGKDLFAARAACGFTAARPIFIVGMPRSGSTLIDQILAAHPDVHCLSETMDIDGVAQWARGTFTEPLQNAAGPQALAAMPDAFFADLGDKTWRIMQSFAPGTPRIADKMLGNFQSIGLIRLALPEARIIHCRRNPVDTCLSAFQRNFQGRNLVTCDLGDLGRFYRAYTNLMDHWHAVLPGFIHDIQYETLTEEPESVLRALFDRLDLSFDPAFLDLQGNRRSVRTASRGQVQQTIYRTSVDRWRRYESHLGPLLDALGPLAGPRA